LPLLRTWTFVNLGTLSAFCVSLLLLGTPSKVAAEPSLLAYLPHTFLAGLAWLGLALVRFLVIQRDNRQ
jgi:hypothetical protein